MDVVKWLATVLCWSMVNMPGKSYTGTLAPLTEQETKIESGLRKHIDYLSTHIGQRNMQHFGQLCAAADYVKRQFQEMKLPVKELKYSVNGKEVENIEAEIKGTDTGKIIVVGAHYDTVPGSPGANDNTSGVAAMLELARSMANSKPSVSMRFVCFVNEEKPYAHTPMMGSLVYAQLCHQNKDNIIGAISLETMGYYSDAKGSQRYPFPFSLIYPDQGNFIAFVGNSMSQEFLRNFISLFRQEAQFPSEGVAAPDWIPNIDRSDHKSFWQFGYPAIMITDTANFRYPDYHKATDTIDKINFDHLSRVVVGLERTFRKLATVNV